MKNLYMAIAASIISMSALANPVSGTDGFGNPVVPGATSTIDFDSQGDATFSSLSLGGVTFSGIGGTLRTDNSFPNDYNGRGARYLDNSAGATNGFRFDFSAPLSGFAFNFGASDVAWTLTGFDALGNLLESYQLPVVSASNQGDYFGLTANGTNFSYATLTSSATAFDWVFVDNFTIAAAGAAIPEPGSFALLGLGLLGLVSARSKSKKRQ